MFKKRFLYTFLVLVTLLAGIGIGTLIRTNASADSASKAAPLAVPNPVQLSNSFAELAKKLEPSVVNISSVYEVKSAQRSQRRTRPLPGEEDEEGPDLFFRFFGNPFRDFPDPGPQRRSGVGSGVVVDKSGYILTNNHVVEKADRIRVKLSGDTTLYDAKLIGSDEETDLAVIKIEPKKELTVAKVGNSDSVQVGDWAVAIGSPFGLQATVTAGIISAKEREITPGQSFQHFLQTDAAINPGNSGGPLINLAGEVIGINTAIATRTGGYQGIGFALPSNMAIKVYNSIIKSGKVTRGSIGVGFRDQPELLKAYGANSGVFVQNVEPGGPAAKAGIKAEDVIVAFDGKPIHNGQELINYVADTPVGKEATVTVFRNEKKMDFKLTIEDRTKVFASRYGGSRPEQEERGEGETARFGITIENLGASQRQSWGFNERGGVIVRSVEPGSFADDIGIEPNDVILAINRQPIDSVSDVRRLQDKLRPGDSVAFRIMRPGSAFRGGRMEWASLYLAGTLPK